MQKREHRAICRITRLRDGFSQVTGVGSLEGCINEAESIVKRLRSGHVRIDEVSLTLWEGDLVKVECPPEPDVLPEIAWTPEEFFWPKLQGDRLTYDLPSFLGDAETPENPCYCRLALEANQQIMARAVREQSQFVGTT